MSIWIHEIMPFTYDSWKTELILISLSAFLVQGQCSLIQDCFAIGPIMFMYLDDYSLVLWLNYFVLYHILKVITDTWAFVLLEIRLHESAEKPERDGLKLLQRHLHVAVSVLMFTGIFIMLCRYQIISSSYSLLCQYAALLTGVEWYTSVFTYCSMTFNIVSFEVIRGLACLSWLSGLSVLITRANSTF